jgi:Tfp pilus assembly PilM family ATPase
LENGGVRAAEISGSGRHVRIGRIVGETTLDAEDTAGESLREFFDRFHLRRDNVVLCLAGRDSLMRRMKLPLSNLRQIERTVKFQAEKFVIDQSLEDIVVDFFVIDRTKTDTDVFLLAVKKENLRNKLQLLKVAGISPIGITIDSVAVFNLVAAAGVLPKKGSAALLEFSSDVCRIILARDRKLVFLRALNISGFSQDELAERVARELRASCLVAGVEQPLESVIVAGDGSEGTICQALTRRISPLGTDITTFNPFKTFPSDTTEEENGGSDDAAAIALGAALKGIKAESVPVDFRKEEFALRSGFDFVRVKLMYLLGALVVLFGMLLAQSYYDAAQKQNYLDKIDAEARGYWNTIFPTKPFPPNTFDKHIKSRAARRGSSTLPGPRYLSMLETIRQIATVLPEQQKATVRSINFDQKHVVLAGDAEDFSQFEALVNALRNMKGYKVKEKFEKRGRPGGPQRLLFSIELIPVGGAK